MTEGNPEYPRGTRYEIMNISGIGIVFTGGRGIECYQKTLEQGWTVPLWKKFVSRFDISLPVYCLKQGTLADKTVLKKIRRADRFSKMAVLAAWDAFCDSGVSIKGKEAPLGIIVATGLGPHVTTFRFLDDILDYGEKNVSPTIFSHSVHNAAASYISLVLGAQGPTLTLTQFNFSFQQALILAQTWIKEGRCSNVLVGSVDELGTVMEYICGRKLKIARDGKIKPFRFSKDPEAVPGEGSVFFLVTEENSGRRYCEISDISGDNASIKEYKADMYIFDADGMSGSEQVYRDTVDSNALIGAYTPLFGSMMAGSSFHCAAAALMLKNQFRYASPVQDNPYAMNLCTAANTAKINKISCVKYNCGREKAVINLRR